MIVKELKCRECGRGYGVAPIHVCEYCFGPLEVVFDYSKIELSKDMLAERPFNMWRYKEFLPVEEVPEIGLEVGYTPLMRARNLEKYLGMKEIWIKNDAVNFPTLSFKDRVVTVAVAKAKEFGFDVVACASTGNLANSVAACAAAYGMKAYVFIPYDLERTKIVGTSVYGADVIAVKGTYDEVNRLCAEIASRYRWAFVNINIRPFYSEGSKTFGFEVVEQLGWRLPDHIIVPMAGGSLIIKVCKAFRELEMLGFVKSMHTKFHGAQAEGCAPIVDAVWRNLELFVPVKEPKTVAKSLAIGNPPDGYYAAKVIRESGGWAEAPNDSEIIEAMQILAEKEGIFTETAGGVTFGAMIRLVESGHISRSDSVVLSITGNGLKTQEALYGHIKEPKVIHAKLHDFEELLGDKSEKYRIA